MIVNLFSCSYPIMLSLFGSMSLNTMMLTIESPQVYTKQGVAISVTGIAQVSCSQDGWACCAHNCLLTEHCFFMFCSSLNVVRGTPMHDSCDPTLRLICSGQLFMFSVFCIILMFDRDIQVCHTVLINIC